MNLDEIVQKSFQSGIGGAGAMTVSVSTLMWMRTVMNYQYRYGGSVPVIMQKLYQEGGIRRFYRGFSVAIVQGPLSRFGDTFSNTLALSFLETSDISLSVKTGVASVFAGVFRIFLTPIDTLKTTLQVEGLSAVKTLRQKSIHGGPQIWFHGALATSLATMVGHYPWFVTYNYLDAYLPEYSENAWKRHSRNAVIGFLSSVVSDTLSNCLRVLKTIKQTHSKGITYSDAFYETIRKEGIYGMWTRGLGIRLLTNGVQGLLFTVVWKSLAPK